MTEQTALLPERPAPLSLPAAAAAADQVSSSWRGTLSAWLQSHRAYPDEARRRAEEGVVVVRFIVGRDGRVLEVTVLRGSGSPMLDGAAQDMLRGARLPPFPGDMLQSQATVTVPVRYRLER